MEPQVLLGRLIRLEKHVEKLYVAFGDLSAAPAEVRFFWNNMATDEAHHAAILQRTAGLLDLLVLPPQASAEVLDRLEAKINALENAAHQQQLSMDDAFRAALELEGSELNNLTVAWVRGLRPEVAALLEALLPEEEDHLRRLVEVTHTFSRDPALHQQADDLWCLIQREAEQRQTKENA
jgi:rubrerythrin